MSELESFLKEVRSSNKDKIEKVEKLQAILTELREKKEIIYPTYEVTSNV